MLHDIAPKKMDINFKNRVIEEDDFLVVIDGGELLIKELDANSTINVFPTYGVLNKKFKLHKSECMYLSAIDDQHYYLYRGENLERFDRDYKRIGRRDLYSGFENVDGFVAYTASHIYDWIRNNKFCGKCGGLMDHKSSERVLECPDCSITKYPQINPVVIVCIHDGDKILLTKYANSSYDRYALVAGFVEIGESFEDAVHREVLEEVGIKVKNLKYFASQPWGISGGLMAGYFAELEGDARITLDTEELKEGTWLTKDEMPEVFENEKSLTRTLMYEWYQKQSR